MKRFVLLILAAVMLFCLPLTGCKPKDPRHIRLCEVTHSIFYAPLYVAINNGYFEEKDITIELSDGKGAQNVMAAITSKSADIGLMGPEATIYCHVNGQKDYPVIFGQLTQKDGSFLVSKNPEPDFEWSNLNGKHVLAGRPGGVPAMTLQYVIESEGLKLKDLNFDTSVPFESMVGAFEGDKNNEYDYCTMFEPLASSCEARGKGYIVAAVGAYSGYVPYTAFSASKSYLSENREVAKDFLAAVMKGYEFMENNSLDDVAAALKPSFFETDIELIKKSIEHYLAIEAWCSNPAMTLSSFNRLQDIMENADNLTSRASFSRAVDNSIANDIIG